MNARISSNNRVAVFVLMVLTLCMLQTGCARYAKEINSLYQPVVAAHKGSGDLYIVIPENQQSPSARIKWVLGKVTDDENKKIDELTSTRSPAEMAQAALVQELRRAGYNVFPVSQRPASHAKLLDIAKVDVVLDQVSDFADLKATCRVVVDVDIYRNGQLVRKQQYQAASTKTDIKDRNLLARAVFDEAMQAVMLNAVPGIIQQLEK